GCPHLAEEIVEVLGGDVVVLGQDALERAAAMALAVVVAAVEIGLLRHLETDAEQLEELRREPAAFVDRLEAERSRVMDEKPRIVHGNVGEYGEGRLDEGEIAQADGADDERGREAPALVQMLRQAQRLGGRRSGRQERCGSALASVEHEI